jgi:uncharacterized protein (DUF433 family)
MRKRESTISTIASAQRSGRSVKHPYVTRKRGTCAGKPIIIGTRIKVEQIAVEYESMGLTADEIVQRHPHLTLAQVHDALSYYYDNIDQIKADLRAGEELVRELRKLYPLSVVEDKLKNRVEFL